MATATQNSSPNNFITVKKYDNKDLSCTDFPNESTQNVIKIEAFNKLKTKTKIKNNMIQITNDSSLDDKKQNLEAYIEILIYFLNNKPIVIQDDINNLNELIQNNGTNIFNYTIEYNDQIKSNLEICWFKILIIELEIQLRKSTTICTQEAYKDFPIIIHYLIDISENSSHNPTKNALFNKLIKLTIIPRDINFIKKYKDEKGNFFHFLYYLESTGGGDSTEFKEYIDKLIELIRKTCTINGNTMKFNEDINDINIDGIFNGIFGIQTPHTVTNVKVFASNVLKTIKTTVINNADTPLKKLYNVIISLLNEPQNKTYIPLFYTKLEFIYTKLKSKEPLTIEQKINGYLLGVRAYLTSTQLQVDEEKKKSTLQKQLKNLNVLINNNMVAHNIPHKGGNPNNDENLESYKDSIKTIQEFEEIAKSAISDLEGVSDALFESLTPEQQKLFQNENSNNGNSNNETDRNNSWDNTYTFIMTGQLPTIIENIKEITDDDGVKYNTETTNFFTNLYNITFINNTDIVTLWHYILTIFNITKDRFSLENEEKNRYFVILYQCIIAFLYIMLSIKDLDRNKEEKYVEFRNFLMREIIKFIKHASSIGGAPTEKTKIIEEMKNYFDFIYRYYEKNKEYILDIKYNKGPEKIIGQFKLLVGLDKINRYIKQTLKSNNNKTQSVNNSNYEVVNNSPYEPVNMDELYKNLQTLYKELSPLSKPNYLFATKPPSSTNSEHNTLNPININNSNNNSTKRFINMYNEIIKKYNSFKDSSKKAKAEKVKSYILHASKLINSGANNDNELVDDEDLSMYLNTILAYLESVKLNTPQDVLEGQFNVIKGFPTGQSQVGGGQESFNRYKQSVKNIENIQALSKTILDRLNKTKIYLYQKLTDDQKDKLLDEKISGIKAARNNAAGQSNTELPEEFREYLATRQNAQAQAKKTGGYKKTHKLQSKRKNNKITKSTKHKMKMIKNKITKKPRKTRKTRKH